MKPGGKWLLIALAGLIAALAGNEFGRGRTQLPKPEPAAPGVESAVATVQLLLTPLATLDGQTRKLSDWQDKILVVNFWATWCPPCRKEMPEFSRAQDQYGPNGVQFVGIAIDEAANVVEFSKTMPTTYPLLMAPADLPGLIAKLGNRQQALPFTIIIGRDGKLLFSHLGALDQEDLAKRLVPLL